MGGLTVRYVKTYGEFMEWRASLNKNLRVRIIVCSDTLQCIRNLGVLRHCDALYIMYHNVNEHDMDKKYDLFCEMLFRNENFMLFSKVSVCISTYSLLCSSAHEAMVQNSTQIHFSRLTCKDNSLTEVHEMQSLLSILMILRPIQVYVDLQSNDLARAYIWFLSNMNISIGQHLTCRYRLNGMWSIAGRTNACHNRQCYSRVQWSSWILFFTYGKTIAQYINKHHKYDCSVNHYLPIHSPIHSTVNAEGQDGFNFQPIFEEASRPRVPSTS